MKDISISEGVVPLGEFKAHASRYLKQLDGPVVITQHGRPAAVLISPGEYDQIREQWRFIESLTAGLDDSQNGRVMDTEELKARLASAREQRLSR
jgi:prevent-host-death family protein